MGNREDCCQECASTNAETHAVVYYPDKIMCRCFDQLKDVQIEVEEDKKRSWARCAESL